MLNKIGEGSYSGVYLAEYSSTPNVIKHNLACKVIDTSNAPSEFVRKFLPRELEVLIKVNHPHIIHIHSVFQKRAKYYIFMRYAENGDLLEYIMKNGAISEGQTRFWVRQIALAVQYLHSIDIVHRDLKCENILITSKFNVKLADFGFSRFMNNKSRSSTYCGSLSYAAPEILKGTPYNPTISDVWSLGIVLYVMLNKAMPFDDSNVKRLYELQVKKKWKFRSKIERDLSLQVKTLLQRILEPDITKRWTLEQILTSDWIKMDPMLLEMNSIERIAVQLTKDSSERDGLMNASEEGLKILKTDLSQLPDMISVANVPINH